MHQHHWLTDSQFADLFSISQTAPGPSILIVAHGRLRRRACRSGACSAAIVGGVVATAAMVIPAASLVYAITLFWQRAQESKLADRRREGLRAADRRA